MTAPVSVKNATKLFIYIPIAVAKQMTLREGFNEYKASQIMFAYSPR